MDRAQLFETLSNLPPQDFERLLFAVKPPGGLIPGDTAPQMNRVKALLEWAEGFGGRGLEAIAQPLADLNRCEFDGYLRSLVATYEKWWEHYTLTDAISKVELPTPEKPSVFDFGLMVQTVTKEQDDADPLREKQEKTERLPVLAGIRQYANDHVLLVGRPGSGKSTALIRLLLEEANACLSNSGLLDTYHTISREASSLEIPPAPLKKGGKAVKVPLFKGDLGGSSRASRSIESDVPTSIPSGRGEPERIPVLVELRYWEHSIEGLIQGFLQRHGLTLDGPTLSTLLGQGRFLLLVDGLNELPLKGARTQLSAFRRNHPKLPMIFTTRDLDQGGDLGIEKKLEMQPLTEAQMKEFIRAYVPDQAEAMLRQLSDRLREFGQTPLLLWMLCEVFQQSPHRQMPTNLAEVFRAFTMMYENSSVRKHEVALLKGDVRPLSDRRLWKDALKALAALMMQGETPVDFRVAIHRTEAERELGKLFAKEKYPVRDIVDDLLKYHLLQNCTTDQLEFRHQLLQEYYAAEHLLDLLPDLLETEEKFKHDYLNLLKWTEAIALMLALVNDEAQAIRAVKLATSSVDLILGARLAGEVNYQFQAQAIKIIQSKTVPIWLRIRLLGITKSDKAVNKLEKFLNDKAVDVRRDAIDSLAEISTSKSITLLERMLSDTASSVSRSSLEALGRISTSESIGALLRAWRCEKNNLRVHIVNLLASKIFNRELYIRIYIDGFLVYPENNPDQAMIRPDKNSAFSEIDGGKSRNARNSSLSRHIDDESKETQAPSLCSQEEKDYGLSDENIEKSAFDLAKEINSKDEVVRIAAITAIGKASSKTAPSSLIKTLIDKEKNSPTETVSTLDQAEVEKFIPSLVKAVSDKNNNIRAAAISALGKIEMRKVVPSLLQAINDKDNHVRAAAISALGKMEIEKVVPDLIKAINDEDKHVQIAAISALGKMGTEKIGLFIKESLGSEGLDGASPSEILALVKMGFQEAVPYLLEILKNKDARIREHAASSLGELNLDELGSQKAIYNLIESLNDEDKNVRSAAIAALGKICSETSKNNPLEISKAIPNLIGFLDDKDQNVRAAAVAALGKIYSEISASDLYISHRIVPRLIQSLDDKDQNVRAAAIVALVKMEVEEAIPHIVNALFDKDKHVRSVAILSARRINKRERLIAALMKKCECENRFLANDSGFIQEERVYDVIAELICILTGEFKNKRKLSMKIIEKIESQKPDIESNNASHADGLDLYSFARVLREIGAEEAIFGMAKIYISTGFDSSQDLHLDGELALSLKDSLIKIAGSEDRNSQKLAKKIPSSQLIDANLISHPSPTVRESLARDLGEIGTEKDVKILESFLLDDPVFFVRLAAAKSLGEIGSSEAVDSLVQSLRDDVASSVRQQSARALSGIRSKNKKSTNALIQALKDPDSIVREAAADSLGNIVDSEAFDVLPNLEKMIPGRGDREALLSITAIQNKCGFYNYGIAKSLISYGKTISLYLSYAAADEALQTQLAKHLTLLERQGVITSWSSHQILPGSDRTQTIHQQLNTADIILLLISPDAIADDTCYHLEIQRAIEQHQAGEARVIPILLRPVDWQGAPFSHLDVLPKNHQSVTTWPNQDEAFREIAEGIRQVAMEMRRGKDNSGKIDEP